MPIEKAFAINAPPELIYAAIERDLSGAAEHVGETFEVMRADPPRSIELRVTIGGFPCFLSYRLTPQQAYTEVTAKLEPYGVRYTAFRVLTLGMRDGNFAVPLVEGLANLKAEVESGPAEFPDEDARMAAPPDE